MVTGHKRNNVGINKFATCKLGPRIFSVTKCQNRLENSAELDLSVTENLAITKCRVIIVTPSLPKKFTFIISFFKFVPLAFCALDP